MFEPPASRAEAKVRPGKQEHVTTVYYANRIVIERAEKTGSGTQIQEA